MKVLALIQSPDHVCYRYRIEAFAWALAERGLQLESVPLRQGTWARIGQLRAAARADVVILQRRLLPIWQSTLLRLGARHLVYDLDDALYQRDSYSRKGPQSSVRMARFWATVYAADAVTVGNHYLERFTSAFVRPEQVHVIPTCVEPRWYHLARHRRVGSAARLVWIGQQSTLASLDRARECLAAAAGRLPGLALRMICDRSVGLPGVKVEPRRWSSATEAAELADGDIGVNWLPDDRWSRGKCGLKVLQYMAAGLPVVANPLGENRRMVVDGQTGLLASTPREWAEAIARLAADPSLRRRMGAAGRRLVDQRYSVADWGPRFAQVIHQVVCGEKRASRAVQAGHGAPPRAVVNDALATGPYAGTSPAARSE
ncbi:MAG: glycosyltransferase family 4 protein [Planctomycetota bacterium]|jgi:glycosyltransferase involved in cell wall biosynthesis